MTDQEKFKANILAAPDKIAAIVDRLARDIRKDYASKDPLLLGVLKGAFVFISDLARALNIPLEVDFVQTSLYEGGKTPSDSVKIIRDVTTEIRGRDIIIVDDIIDSGRTLHSLISHMTGKGPASISVCTLLLRKGGAHGLKIDYTGMLVDEGFAVGYGMDYRERYRELPGLYILE